MMSQNRNYRGWTSLEEAKLVEALVNMVNGGGFKSDKGFKSGYLQFLEQMLKESLPNSGILGKPHIESKMKVMKKDWKIVHDMLNGSNTSGFGYDSVTHCLIAEDGVWESYIKVHKWAVKWKNKTFPYYEDLCIVFGKNRAQGNKARDFVEMEEETNTEEQIQHLGNDSDNIMESSNIPRSHSNVQNEETSRACNKKRKNRVDPMLEAFNDADIYLGDILKKMLNKMNKGIEREEEFDKKSAMITSEIFKMQSLTQIERFRVITKIRANPERVKIFWDLVESDREAFVKFILEE